MSLELPKKVVDTLPTTKAPEKPNQNKDKQVAQLDLNTTNALEKLATDTEAKLKTKPAVNELLKDLWDAKTNLASLTDFVKKNPDIQNIPENQKEILDVFSGWHLYGSLIKSILNSKKPEYKVLDENGKINISRLKNIIASLEKEYESSYQNFQLADFDAFVAKKIWGVNIFDPVENKLIQTLDSTKNWNNTYKKYIYENRQKYLDEMTNFLQAYNWYLDQKNSSSLNASSSSTTAPAAQTSTDTWTQDWKDVSSTITTNSAPSYPTDTTKPDKAWEIKDFLTQNAWKIGFWGLGILGLYLLFRKKNKSQSSSEWENSQESNEEKWSFFKTLLKWWGIGAIWYFAYNWFKNQSNKNPDSSAPSQDSTWWTAENTTQLQDIFRENSNLSTEQKQQLVEFWKQIDEYYGKRINTSSNLKWLWDSNFSSLKNEKYPGVLEQMTIWVWISMKDIVKEKSAIEKLLSTSRDWKEFFSKWINQNLESFQKFGADLASSIVWDWTIWTFVERGKKIHDSDLYKKATNIWDNWKNWKAPSSQELNDFFNQAIETNPNFYDEFTSLMLGRYLKTANYIQNIRDAYLYETISQQMQQTDPIVKPYNEKFSKLQDYQKQIILKDYLETYKNDSKSLPTSLLKILNEKANKFNSSAILNKKWENKPLMKDIVWEKILSLTDSYSQLLLQEDKQSISEAEKIVSNVVWDSNILNISEKNISSLENWKIKSMLNRWENSLERMNANALSQILWPMYPFFDKNLEKMLLQNMNAPFVKKILAEIKTLKSKSSYDINDIKSMQDMIKEYANMEKEVILLQKNTNWIIEESENWWVILKLKIAWNSILNSWSTFFNSINLSMHWQIKDGVMEFSKLWIWDMVWLFYTGQIAVRIPLVILWAVRIVWLARAPLMAWIAIWRWLLVRSAATKAAETAAIWWSEKILWGFIWKRIATRFWSMFIPWAWLVVWALTVADIALNWDQRKDLGSVVKDLWTSLRDKASWMEANYNQELKDYGTDIQKYYNLVFENENPNLQKIYLKSIKDHWLGMWYRARKWLIYWTAASILTYKLQSIDEFKKLPASEQEKTIKNIQENIKIENISDSDWSWANIKLPNTPYTSQLTQAFNEWYTPFMQLNLVWWDK